MNRPILFGQNLKYHREKCGLTQMQLAQQIGYTEKSVSKWENENGLPILETIVKLADLFGVSLDELVYKNSNQPYFLGIDGGGTKTLFQLVDENGAVIHTVKKGSSNPNDIGMENACAILTEGIQQVCKGIPYGKVSMFAGISGGGLTGNNAKTLHKFFGKFGFAAYDNGSDVENLIALTNGEPCALVIMGTGFIAYALKGEQRKRIAGWGQFFDEGGCAYTLGRDAIVAMMREEDGSGATTVLTPLIQKRIGENAEAHLAKFYQGGKSYVAGFADTVLEAIKQNDQIAMSILEKNMAFAAHMIDTAIRELTRTISPIPVYIAGGISAQKDVIFPLLERFSKENNRQLIRLEQEPVEGAIRRAREIYESTVQREL